MLRIFGNLDLTKGIYLFAKRIYLYADDVVLQSPSFSDVNITNIMYPQRVPKNDFQNAAGATVYPLNHQKPVPLSA